MALTSPPAADSLKFEDAIDQLEALIEKVESGEIGLEQAMQQYEVGQSLIQHCQKILDSAQRKIAQLAETPEGELAVADEEDPAS